MIDGRKSNVVVKDDIFPSMLKNHLSALDGLQGFQPIMPLVYDGWFLTCECNDIT
ncbi:hypothetical protein HYS31_04490 [Candidatus Woesearchaeota archaeon]|nr:hypothetical protein [Candidatus Woesearchaeota archaeon]